MAACFYRAAQLCIQGFDRVRGVDDAPDRDGKRKERDDLGPVAPPALGDGRIFAPPRAGVEGVERRLAGFGVLGAIDRPQFAGDRLASFQEANSMEWRIKCTMQVCTTVSGKTALIASGEPFSPSTTATRISPMPRFLSSFMTRGTVRNLVCGAIVKPQEVSYGNQEGYTGRATFGTRSPAG